MFHTKERYLSVISKKGEGVVVVAHQRKLLEIELYMYIT